MIRHFVVSFLMCIPIAVYHGVISIPANSKQCSNSPTYYCKETWPSGLVDKVNQPYLFTVLFFPKIVCYINWWLFPEFFGLCCTFCVLWMRLTLPQFVNWSTTVMVTRNQNTKINPFLAHKSELIHMLHIHQCECIFTLPALNLALTL